MTPAPTSVELHEIALAAWESGRADEARAAALRARDMFVAEDGPDSPDAANAANLLAEIAEAGGQYAEAEAHGRYAWEIMQRLGDRCTGPEADTIRVEALSRIGGALRGAGKYAEAEPWLKQAAGSFENAGTLNNLAVLYKYSGNFAEGERIYQRALALAAASDNREQVATIYHNIGGIAHAQGHFTEGEAPARRAWEIRRELRGDDDPITLADACALAGVLDGLERYEESERIYRHAISVFESIYGPEHLEVAYNLNNLAAVRQALGDQDEASGMYERALAIKRKVLGDTHPDTALTACNYASLLLDMGRGGEACELARWGSAALEASLPQSHPRVRAAQEILSRCVSI
jgi:tetratricopeptide (TPR) repeat protein